MSKEFKPIVIEEKIDAFRAEVLENIDACMIERFKQFTRRNEVSIVEAHKIVNRIANHLANNGWDNKVLFLANNVKIVFNPRLRTAGGRANYKTLTIELNEKLHKENPNEFETTIAHEFAHLVSHMFWGQLGTGHGIKWKKTMRAMGYVPNRTHDMKAEVRRHKVKATGTCGCGITHKFKTRAYNKVLSGANYRCGRCRTKITNINLIVEE